MNEIVSPDMLFKELFDDVQKQRVFADSKTFADAVPNTAPELVVGAYRVEKLTAGFDLKSFVERHFDLPESTEVNLVQPEQFQAATEQELQQHIKSMWAVLKRQPQTTKPYDSLIGLPHDYIVPGGRFREIYYWDSYFTLLGLVASNDMITVRNMVDNFAHLIDTLGFIPNGNRSYYCSRSQPPLFAFMVELLVVAEKNERLWLKYLPALMQEYEYWMRGGSKLLLGQSYRRVINYKGCLFNRYWDDSATPRQESYKEDIALVQRSEQSAEMIYRNVRAACETGWDFSSRWLRDDSDLTSLRTTDIVPVDLNCIFVRIEKCLAHAWKLAGDSLQAQLFTARAQRRAELLQADFFDAVNGEFVDLLLPNFIRSSKTSVATAWPLFVGVATTAQAAVVAESLAARYLAVGGWLTTTRNSGQQWDAPNGWAPLQWVVYQGLQRYGHADIANQGARNWIDNNLACFKSTGMLFEKYDVQRLGTPAGGGEYPVQSGFGWTNAVLLCLMDALAGKS